MDPITGSLISGGVSALGGIIGGIASGKSRREARDALSEAIGQFSNIKVPEAKKLLLEKYRVEGVLTPELEQEILLADPKVAEIQLDNELKQARLSALRELERASKGGLSPEARMEMNLLQRDLAQQQMAQRASIQDAMRRQGMGGSGAELAALLQSGQSDINRAAQQADRLAARSNEAKMAALERLGSLAGDIQRQDFDIERQKAEAMDIANRLRTQMEVERQRRNLEQKNEAQKFNLSTKQAISNKNIEMLNQEERDFLERQQQEFLNRMKLAEARSGILTGRSNLAQQQAESKAKMWSDIGTGLGKALMGGF